MCSLRNHVSTYALEACASPGYEHILSGQAMLVQELPQGSAHVGFIPVDGCTIKGPVTRSQGGIHGAIHFFRAVQLVSPQPQEGHLNPSIQGNRGGGGGRHPGLQGPTLHPVRNNWFAKLYQRRIEKVSLAGFLLPFAPFCVLHHWKIA